MDPRFQKKLREYFAYVDQLPSSSINQLHAAPFSNDAPRWSQDPGDAFGSYSPVVLLGDISLGEPAMPLNVPHKALVRSVIGRRDSGYASEESPRSSTFNGGSYHSPPRWCPADEDEALYGCKIDGSGSPLADGQEDPFDNGSDSVPAQKPVSLREVKELNRKIQQGRSLSLSEQLRYRYGEGFSHETPSTDDMPVRDSGLDDAGLSQGIISYGPPGDLETNGTRAKYPLSSLRVPQGHRTASSIRPANATAALGNEFMDSPSLNFDTPGKIVITRRKEHSAGLGKRGREESKEKGPSPAQKEIVALEDDVLGNPSKKRRISSHIVRESVGSQHNADIGAGRRRSLESPQPTPQSPRSDPLLLKIGRLAKSKSSSMEKSLGNTPFTLVNDPIKETVDYILATNAKKEQKQGPMASFNPSQQPNNRKPKASDQAIVFSRVQKSFRNLRISTRLATSQQHTTAKLAQRIEQSLQDAATSVPYKTGGCKPPNPWEKTFGAQAWDELDNDVKEFWTMSLVVFPKLTKDKRAKVPTGKPAFRRSNRIGNRRL